MKKAKRLLAMIMAFVMLCSAACIPTYAYKAESDNYYVPKTGNDGKYYLTYEQAAGWLLDLLDDLLKESNIIITPDDFDDMIDIGISLFGGSVPLVDMGGFLEDAGATYNGEGALILTSVDGLIKSLVGAMTLFRDANLLDVVKFFGLADEIAGDIIDSSLGTSDSGETGIACLDNLGSLNKNTLRANSLDKDVLEMLVTFIYEKRALLTGIIGGTCDLGLLAGVLSGFITDFLPGAREDGNYIKDLDVGVKNLLYSMLIDDTVTTMPEGMTIDKGVQKLVNWALIEGTGLSADTGAHSLLGENMEPLMPAIADKPGAATVINSTETIYADRDGDGVAEAHTMNFYQLVANAIDALLGGMLGPILSELLYGLVDIEITEQFPYGDPAIMSDSMFNLIIGLVESLLVQNGAPEIHYSDLAMTYPAPKIDALVDWLFNGGALDTFILIDYNGIKIQDNFMSLLNDLIRLLVNMLPSFGLFESSAHLGYQSDELTAVWFYDEAKNLVTEDAEGAVDQTYITYENGDILYATQYEEIDGVTTATAYNYILNDMPVNIVDETAGDYVNPDFVRPNYVVPTKEVYATIIKMALNDFIEGCYFPEWTTDIPSVLAYGLAALAAPATPQNNYYARLDAYHELTMNGGVGVVVDANNRAIDPIPYTTQKAVKTNEGTKYVTVPTGALSIGCSYLAAYLNTVFQFDQDSHMLSTDTTVEQFASEFLIWGFTKYAPLFAGQDANNDGKMDSSFSTGVSAAWYAEVNSFIDAIYSDFTSRTYKETANFDAIYDLLDATLFSLIPTSWLPDIAGSSQFVNDWLLGNLIEFDLQGILGLLSVNHDPEAELNKYAVIPVVIRILDRVLAIVFGDNSILHPSGRTNVAKNQNVTSMVTLDEVLSAQSLVTLIDRLLYYIQKFKVPLLSTFLPLIAGANYERPYETSILGSLGNSYTIEDLENYVDYFNDNVNASLVTTVEDEEFANLWVKADGSIVRTADGTAYEVQLGEQVYGPYPTRQEAKDALEMVKGCYVFARKDSETVDETTGEVIEHYVYDIYRPWSYIDYTATENPNAIDKENGETYSTFSDFRFANINSRNPYASYETEQFRFFNYEDFGNKGYVYRNAKDSVDEAEDFISSYNSYTESTLSDAYGDWLMFSVYGRLQAADLYDANDDGRSVTSESDGDYVASTETDPGYPVDGLPGVPGSMYPFYSTASTQYTFEDSATGNDISLAMSEFNEVNYEQLAMALEHSNDIDNYIPLSVSETESVVRLALNTLAFDITPDGNGAYNAGSSQWETLTSSQLTAIGSWCQNNNFLLEVDAENGIYQIKRASFGMFTASSSFGISGVGVTPITTSTFNGYLAQTMAQADTRTDAEEMNIDIYKAYIDYISSLYYNRRSLFNKIDYIGFRYEAAETLRVPSTDVTMLSWVINHTADAYKDPSTNLRNQYDTGVFDVVEGKNRTDKVYTTTSYEAFRRAVDYGKSLVEVSKSSVLSNELTQSMVSEAYIGILEAYQALVRYTGAADWTELNNYIVTATEILNDPNKNDPVLGYASGLDILEITNNDAILLKADSEIDSERQSEVDLMAAALRQAILNLVYNTMPSIVTQKKETGENQVGTVKTQNSSTRVVGQVFGLSEGVGAVMDVIKLVGMMKDEATGNNITIEGSGRGNGTGAYYKGTVGNIERFRYYAVIYGDINGDARVDGTDASALEIYIALKTNTSNGMGAAKFEAADANHDGIVDELDVAAMVDHYTYKKDESGNFLTIDQTEHSSGVTVEDGDTDATVEV